MVMSLSQQIGALSGTPMSADSGFISVDTTPATVSASSGSKSPTASLRCKARSTDFDQMSLSPPLSPRIGGMRPDLSVACQTLMTEGVAPAEVREYKEVVGPGVQVKEKGVPVYVMMPLDSVTMGNTVSQRKAVNVSMQALKSAGVEGVMMDVWWGLVEGEAPGEYNWGGYVEFMEMAKKHGLKVQAVMSFHQCGGNVGDSCTLLGKTSNR